MIINTRPEEVSKKIIELFEQEKIECKHIHMSRIEILSGIKKQQICREVIKNIHTFANIIFTSQTSAKFGSKLFNSNPGLLNSKQNIFSVGDATKKILIDHGFKSITPTNKSSQGIIDLIKEKFPGKNLIFCGENSNMNLQNAFKENMNEVVCYKLIFDKNQLQDVPKSSAVILIYNFLTFEFIYKNLVGGLIENKSFVLASERIKSEVSKIVEEKEILNKIYVSKSYMDEDMLEKAKEII
jgi:uroporphyrinogen-III synthase